LKNSKDGTEEEHNNHPQSYIKSKVVVEAIFDWRPEADV